MTSLKGDVRVIAGHRTNRDIELWAEGYIKELKEHMVKWRVIHSLSLSLVDSDTAITLTIQEVLRFLKLE